MHKPFPCIEVSGAAYAEESERLNCFCQANPVCKTETGSPHFHAPYSHRSYLPWIVSV